MIRVSLGTLILFGLVGCVTQVTTDAMRYPYVVFEGPHHAWIEPGAETIAVVMSSCEYTAPGVEILFTAHYALSVAHYRNDPGSGTLSIERWEKGVGPTEAAGFDPKTIPDPNTLTPPPGARPVVLVGRRVVLEGGSPRLDLRDEPSTLTRIGFGILVPFAVLLDVALLPIYLVGGVIILIVAN